MSNENTKIRRESLCESTEIVEGAKNTDKTENLQKVPQDRDVVKRLQDQFYIASKIWRRQMNDLRYKLVNERNISSLELGSQTLSECMKELTSAQDALENALQSTVERMTLFTTFEDTSRETNTILQEVNKAIYELKMVDDDRLSIASSRRSKKSSRSKSSRLTTASTTSIARQRRLNLEEELATLRAKMHMAEKKEELDEGNRRALENLDELRLQLQKEETRVKEEIQNATRRFQIAEELAEKKARIDACKGFEEEFAPLPLLDNDEASCVQERVTRFLELQPDMPNIDNSVRENATAAEATPPKDSKLTPELCQMDLSTPEFVPGAVPHIPTNQQDATPPVIEKVATNSVPNESSLVQAQLDVISKLLEVQNQNRLPLLPEPGIFNGDPLQFPIWLKAFETLIEGRAINPAERLHFLGKFVTGEAKELIKGFMLLDGEDAYQKAKEMLLKRFGDSFTVAAAFRKKLDTWPQISPNDVQGLRNYADFLVQCEKAMERISSLNVLDDDQENHKLASKLPRWTLVRWRRLVYNWKEKNHSFPPFSEFATFSCIAIPARRQQIPCPEMAKKWPHLRAIASHLIHPQSDIEVSLLIVPNCSQAIMPREVIPGQPNEPYAQRFVLGWGIIGNVTKPNENHDGSSIAAIVHRVTTCNATSTNTPQRKNCYFAIKPTVKEVIKPAQLCQMLELDFSEGRNSEPPMSQDDKKFLSKMDEGAYQEESGHYVMPLPFREVAPKMPNNKSLALHRLSKLRIRLEKNEKYREDYSRFMKALIEKNHAERVPEKELDSEDGSTWYIPHHGVYHPRKPDKIRVVFDCSAEYKGGSINHHLLQGPDLTNQLVGVLCRFRQDVESMFHQFKVIQAHRNFLQFLWFEDGGITKNPVEYTMTVHLFGAASSPGCANYGFKKIATDHERESGSEAANFVKDNFYVDDGLKSVNTAEHAISLIQETKQLCAKGGLRLHKFASNSKEVIAAIPPEDRSCQLKNLNLERDRLPIERALRVVYRVRRLSIANNSARQPIDETWHPFHCQFCI